MAIRHDKRIRVAILLILPYVFWQVLDLTPSLHHHSTHWFHVPNQCDIFTGNWLYDSQSIPLYASSCPIVEQGFRCNDNGRPDNTYTKWRWKPSQCHIPRFDPRLLLTRFRHKRIALVGDSMGRTQWESLVCMLIQGVSDKSSLLTQVNNTSITKRAPYLAFYLASHNLTVEYHRSPFLVQETRAPKRAPKRVQSVVRLDKLDAREKLWRHADVLIFNTGHWWNPAKTHQIGVYFCVGESIKFGMKLNTAYHTALRTWATWAENVIHNTKTKLIFRTFEPSHWDGPKKQCANSTTPPTILPYNRILERVVRGMKSSVTVLNITALSEVRSDGHIGKWSPGEPPLDCSHWCLPGVPDTWNHLLYITLLREMIPA